jgi:uncharacterized membrane protein required for colicin V production
VYNLPEVLKQINWVDAFYILLLLGMVYRGTRTGVGSQLLSFAGWVAILYLSVRYYATVSEAIFGFMLQGWAKPISFFTLAAAGFIVLKLIERISSVVLGAELSVLEKLGGALVAGLRGCILFGMIGVLLLLVPIDFLNCSAAEGSRTCMVFVNFDAVLYKSIDGLLFSTEEKSSAGDVFETLLSEKRFCGEKKGAR